MTRGANPVLVDGVVAGTWRVADGEVEATCALEGDAADAEVARLARLRGLRRAKSA
jgi:hypothetical protein